MIAKYALLVHESPQTRHRVKSIGKHTEIHQENTEIHQRILRSSQNTQKSVRIHQKTYIIEYNDPGIRDVSVHCGVRHVLEHSGSNSVLCVVPGLVKGD